MKKSLIILILFFNIMQAQTLTDEEKNIIINDFHSENVLIKKESHKQIIEYKVYEVLPEVENTIWTQPIIYKTDYLWILYSLGSPNVKDKALMMLDSVSFYDFSEQVITADEFKTQINEVLFKLGETSNAEAVFQNIEESPSKTASLISLLNNTQYENRAKNELINLALHSRSESSAAIIALEDKYPNEICEIYKNVIRNHPDFSERVITFEDLVSKGCSGLREFINERVFLEPNNAARYEMAHILIKKLNQPQDYKKYIEYHNWERDTLCKGMSGFDIGEYIPIKPESNIQPIEILDSLKSYTSQSNSFGWLGNQDYYTSLVSQLNSAATYLTSNDLINTAKTISSFQKSVDKEYRDSSNTTPNSFITKEGWKYLYYDSQYLLDRLPVPPRTFNLNLNINGNGTVDKSPSQTDYDSSSTVTLTARPSSGYIFKEWSGDITGTNATASVVMNSNKNVTATFVPASSGLTVKLINSSGSLLTGGTLQYYEGSWKDAVNNNDGTFTVNTTRPTISLRMTYEYGSQTKQNVPTTGDIVFQTVNAQVKLQDSNGNLIDQGTVQYYAGAWRSFGTTSNGAASKELLPVNYSFRMTYAYASNDKQQDIGSNPTVVFQTVNAKVQLQNSQGNLMDQGTVQYYAGAWRDFGTTVNGTASKELLPNNYSFRMTYAYSSTDLKQDLNVNPTVVFKTINVQVQLKNSQSNLIDAGTVQYYAGAWRAFGSTSSGTASKELLPGNYSFRMTYEYVSNDKQQDVSTNNVVSFSTVLCTVRVKDAQSQPVNNAQVSYYSGAWRVIGNTVNGEITRELLPAELSFRAKYGTKQVDVKQNLAANNLVEISLP